MEDKRIAKLLLSALLKMEIEDHWISPKEFATRFQKPDKKNLDHLPVWIQGKGKISQWLKPRKF